MPTSTPDALSPLHSPRLQLCAADPVFAGRVAAFYARNAQHLARWEPRRSKLDDAQVQRLSLQQQAQAFAEGSAWRWLLLPAGEEGRVIGTVALSGLQLGFHHSAHLGFALDAEVQGRGLMREALETVIDSAFGAWMNLHRLQAACRPENARSLKLLEGLGFRRIGLAERYLCIDGDWRDHWLLERLNPDFRRPGEWD